jgi:type I restriction enzyme, S subunit
MEGKFKPSPYGQFAADYRAKKLSELCEPDGGIQTGPFGSQLHQEDYVTVGTPIITVEHLGENRILDADIPRVSDADRDRLAKYSLRSGDIVFSRVGSVDRRAIVRPEEDGWLFSGRCLRVRPDQRQINPGYLSYFFGLPSFKGHIRAIAVGATMPSLNTQLLSDVAIYYPKVEEQRAIALILSTIDDKIELNRRMNEALEAAASALFKSWFVDFDPVRAKAAGDDPGLPKPLADVLPDSLAQLELGAAPSGWGIGSILDRANLLSGGTPKTDRPEYWNGRIPWATAKDVSQCGTTFLIHTDRNITERGLEESATQMIPMFSTVVVARGATTGRMALLGREMAMNQTCYALASKIGTPFALYCQLRQGMVNLVHAAHGSVFDTITTTTFANSRIFLPLTAVLESFETRITPLFRRILANIEESRTLAGLRNTLLPKLISGEIRIKDTERIVGERV